MPTTIQAGSAPVILDTGFPVVLASVIAAAQVTPGAALSCQAGQAASNPYFTVQPRGNHEDRILNLHVRGNAVQPTTLTVSIYASDDGGLTWNLYQAAINLVVATVATDYQAIHIVAGLLYQLLVTGLTLGSATNASVDGSVN